jgi:hypothetical protein
MAVLFHAHVFKKLLLLLVYGGDAPFIQQSSVSNLVFFSVLYSALFHLPPLRFHCADGCWDRTQDRCNWCIDIDSQALYPLC